MLENTHGCGEGCLYLGKLQSFAPWSTDWCTWAAHEVVCGPTEGVWVCAGGNGTPKAAILDLRGFLWISVNFTISPKWAHSWAREFQVGQKSLKKGWRPKLLECPPRTFRTGIRRLLTFPGHVGLGHDPVCSQLIWPSLLGVLSLKLCCVLSCKIY
jgi:hypothetical protein